MSYGLFSLFQNLQPVIASTNDKYSLAISSARSCQYQPSASVDFFRVMQLPLQFDCSNVQAKYYQNMPKGSRKRVRLFFQYLNLGNTSTNPKWAIFCQYQRVCKMSSQYSTQLKRHFLFFRIGSSAKSRKMINAISQSLRLDLVNINVYSSVNKVFQMVYELSTFFAFFSGYIFSEFEPRQILD